MPILAATALAAASTIAGKLLGLAWMVWVFKPLTTLLIIAVAQAGRMRARSARACCCRWPATCC